LNANPLKCFDGELYTSEYPFESLSGLIRSKKINEAERKLVDKIQFHIYDYYNREEPNETFQHRFEFLTQLFDEMKNAFGQSENQTEKYLTLVSSVKTEMVTCYDEVKQLHDTYVAEGFEGIMIRNPIGVYEVDKRSKYLHKYKEFMDEEFVIVGYHEGDASDKGCVVWDCITPTNKSFAVRPRGTVEQRKQWFSQGNNYVGKMLTVIFQEYSQDGIPRFPVGKAIRE
jgi:DNA ligase-1